MATGTKGLRLKAQEAAAKVRAARERQEDEGEAQAELDAANSALHKATGTSVADSGDVVEGFPDQLRVEGHVTIPQGIADARLRLREHGIDPEDLDDAAVVAHDKAEQAKAEDQAINDLIRKHTPRHIIGADEPEDLSDEDKADVLHEIGFREHVGAILGKDPTTLTPADLAEFERQSGHDAVIEAVLGKPISELTAVDAAQARQRLRNQEFDERIAAGQASGAGSGSGGGSDPGAGSGGGAGDGSGDDPFDDVGVGHGPGAGAGDGDGGDDVTGGHDDPGAGLPDGPDGDGGSDDVTEGHDDPEGAPPGGDGGGSGAAPRGGSSGSGGSQDTAPPPQDDDEGGFDYFGPTNPSGQSGSFHRDDDGTWTDADGDEVTDPDTVASLEHEFDRYEDEVEQAENAPPEDDPPQGDDDDDDGDEPAEGEGEDGDGGEEDGQSSVEEQEGDPAGPDGGGGNIPDDLRDAIGADLGRLRALRPSTGDGVTDPVDDAGVSAVDRSGPVPDPVEIAHRLLGNPGSAEGPRLVGGGGAGNIDLGANPHGAGVTDPSPLDDDGPSDGPHREQDPFDRGPQVTPSFPDDDPPADDADDDDGGETVVLPDFDSEIVSRLDDGPDLPDHIDLPDDDD
jgi:hypothetical protein